MSPDWSIRGSQAMQLALATARLALGLNVTTVKAVTAGANPPFSIGLWQAHKRRSLQGGTPAGFYSISTRSRHMNGYDFTGLKIPMREDLLWLNCKISPGRQM
jgi:hypothetical protein